MKKAKFERKLWRKLRKMDRIIRKKYPEADYWDISGYISNDRRNVYISADHRRLLTGDIYEPKEVENNG